MSTDDLASRFRPQLSIAGTESPLQEHVDDVDASSGDRLS